MAYEDSASSLGRKLAAVASLVGGILVTLWGGFALQEAVASRHWPTTGGKITACEAVERIARSESEGTTRSQFRTFRFEYRYSVGGVEYSSNEIAPADASTIAELAGFGQFLHDEGYYRRLERLYPVGADVTVHYAPGNPRRAALEPGLSLTALLPLVCGLVLIGLGLIKLRPPA